ncbi:unnamed protein product [Dibothriocephalus latus]|uniref:Ig-like domain-containing protein n=1 Tax=Dibothriocephalus latus TaxID=60516 RepID=A0A3P7N4Z6_DIBLA|nr:unnamed protein product [Dibothriocephalus latus]
MEEACERVHYVTIEPPLGESVSVGVSIRCATQELCDHRFIYYLSLSDVTADYNEDLPPVVTNSSPIRITHEMLGNKIITCIAKGMRHKEVRVSKHVAVEGKPFGIQLVRRNNAAGTLVSDVDIVNANETLLCSSGGFPKPVISWHRVSSPKEHPDYELTIHRSSLVTTIFDPPGYYTYTCQATNELGELSLKHTFYLRNKQHIAFDQQAIVLCWVLVNLGIFACLVWMGQLIVNKELIPFLED